MGLAVKPGLYGADGRLVRAAAYFRGLPQPHFPLEDEAAPPLPTAPTRAPLGPRYIFAGHLTGHFGHFLFSVLGRLWSLPRPLPQDVRLVLLNGVNAPELFELEFSRAIFQSLGIAPESFAAFREPTVFDEILCPDPAVEENHSGRPVFIELCHAIGRRLLGPEMVTPDPRPVFLSKRRLPAGVHKVVNEEDLCGELEARGFQIISPEQLALREQVRLWASRPVVAGMSGSMLHTGVFAPGRRYLALNPERWINSNQAILDRLNGVRGRTLYPRRGYLPEPAPGFAHGLRLPSPAAAAAQIAREADRLRDAPARRLPWRSPGAGRSGP